MHHACCFRVFVVIASLRLRPPQILTVSSYKAILTLVRPMYTPPVSEAREEQFCAQGFRCEGRRHRCSRRAAAAAHGTPEVLGRVRGGRRSGRQRLSTIRYHQQANRRHHQQLPSQWVPSCALPRFGGLNHSRACDILSSSWQFLLLSSICFAVISSTFS
jgi:hypothetical protein